jgi:hypothetical protein
MKANFTLFDPIQIEGKCAVITGQDSDVKATQFRGSDEHPPAAFIRIMCASLTIGPRNADGESRIQKEMKGPPS